MAGNHAADGDPGPAGDRAPGTPERITVLLPCRDQREAFLREAVDSLLAQTSPHWELVVGLNGSPDWIHALVDNIEDRRVRVVRERDPGFARILNRMIEEARTPFVSILLSDDRYAPDAVETLLRYRENHPEADFFHSSRRYIDASGVRYRDPFPSRESFELEHFKRAGSPVKHLLCWRRELSLRIGGMDESLSLHGCDDFDFPWSMAEAGARFRAVAECLYEYRVHDEGPRLTTGTPIQTQVEILERMFAKHGATRAETGAFLDRAADTYLPVAFVGHASDRRDPALIVRRSRRGQHDMVLLPRPGAGGMALAERLCGVTDVSALYQALLLPTGGAAANGVSSIDESIAAANLVVGDGEIRVTSISGNANAQSATAGEPVEPPTRLLLDGILACALDSGLEAVYVRTEPPPGLEAERSGDWWCLPAAPNENGMTRLHRRLELDRRDRTICLTHDIERGRGHLDVDPAFAAEADRRAPAALRRMLEIESAAGVRGTYCVVGSLFEEVRPVIEGRGHALAFHSHDHRLPGPDYREFELCREVDDGVRGYRPPQSRLGPGLEDVELLRHDFEWLASSRSSLGREWPELDNGLAKIPIHLDDFDLYPGRLDYEAWERKVLTAAAEREFVALGLHDCYADRWLDRYPSLLEKLAALGTFRTFDEIADDVVLGASRWTPNPGVD